MAKFFVGQRVRIKDTGDVFPEFVGAEATVLNLGMPEHQIRMDEHGIASARPDALEPITPPHVAGSWEVIEQLLPNIREGVAA